MKRRKSSIQIIDLVNEPTPYPKANIDQVIDLTETEPEVILLDNIDGRLNTPITRSKKRSREDAVSTCSSVSESEVKVLGSSFPLLKMCKSLTQNSQITPSIKHPQRNVTSTVSTKKKKGDRKSVNLKKSNKKVTPKSNKKVTPKSNKKVTPKRKRKLADISNLSRNSFSRSPAQLSEAATDYYKFINKVINESRPTEKVINVKQPKVHWNVNVKPRLRRSERLSQSPRKLKTITRTLTNGVTVTSVKPIPSQLTVRLVPPPPPQQPTLRMVPPLPRSQTQFRLPNQQLSRQTRFRPLTEFQKRFTASRGKPQLHNRLKKENFNNIYNPNPINVEEEGFRPIVIDGCNVAFGHGRGTFSPKGLQICVDFFNRRGMDHVKVFLPQNKEELVSQEVLEDMRTKSEVVFTPVREVNGKIKTCYDDRFIVQYAKEVGGIIVSTDNYRDLVKENASWKEVIHKRLLMFTWVDDLIMFPKDPLGKNGPTLQEFLKF